RTINDPWSWKQPGSFFLPLTAAHRRPGWAAGSAPGLAYGHAVLAVDHRRECPRSAGAILGAGAGLSAGAADGASDDLARALPRPAGGGCGLRRPALRPGRAASADLVSAGAGGEGREKPAPSRPLPHRPR